MMFTDLMDLMLLHHIRIGRHEKYDFRSLLVLITGLFLVSMLVVSIFFLILSVLVNCASISDSEPLLYSGCMLMGSGGQIVWSNACIAVFLGMLAYILSLGLLYLVLLLFKVTDKFYTVSSLSTGILIGLMLLVILLFPLILVTIFLNISFSLIVFPVLFIYLTLVYQRLIYAVFRMQGLMSYAWAVLSLAVMGMAKLCLMSNFLF